MHRFAFRAAALVAVALTTSAAAAKAPQDIDDEPSSGVSLRLDEGVGVLVRTDLGMLWHVEPKRDLAFAMDVFLGLAFVDRNSPLVLVPQLAFGFEDSAKGTFLLELGFGVGADVLPDLFSLILSPRFVVGGDDERSAYGVRTCLELQIFSRVGAIQVSHQALWADGELEHDVRVLLGVNLWMLVMAAMFSGF